MTYKIESWIEELNRKYRDISDSELIDEANNIVLDAIQKLDELKELSFLNRINK